MSLISEIKLGFKNIADDKIGYSFLFFQLVVFSSLVKYFQTDIFLVINLFVCIFYFYSRFHYINVKHVLIILSISIFIFIIPILYSVYNYLYVGYLIRILTGYFIAFSLKDKFVEYYHNLLFVLAFISILLFIVQIVDVNFFSVFEKFSDLVLNEDRRRPGVEGISHEYLILYLVNGWATNRNSGFMWEPAAFGAVLAWAMIFNLFIYRFKINIKLIVLLIALLTTYSVGAYTYLLLILVIYILENRFNLKYYLIIFSFIGFGLYLLTQTHLLDTQFNMMLDKVDNEPEQIDEVMKNENLYNRVSRVVGFYTNWAYFKTFPLGYGFIESKGQYNLLAMTPNGLMVILVRWGILGFGVVFFLFRYGIVYLKNNYYNKIKLLPFALMIVAMILPFAGNPFDNQPFLFALIFFPLWSLPYRGVSSLVTLSKSDNYL